MSKLEEIIDELILANKALALEGVVDAYGHVSARHPDRPDCFLLSYSKAPALIEPKDIIVFDLNCEPVEPESRPLYIERFIHAGIYRARPDIGAVVHSHAEDTLLFGLAGISLRPIIHSASNMGRATPIWDIADVFGDTDLLVRSNDQADDLAKALGSGSVALMRGHGCIVASPTLIELVRLSTYLPKNARILTQALMLGVTPKYLSEGEMNARLFDKGTTKASDFDPNGPALARAWEYYRHRTGGCGCGGKD